MIDTHCHIDETAFDADRDEVIARQKASGVEAMIVPGVNVASIDTVLKVCHAHPGFCYPALGLHPEDVKADWQEQLTIVENAIRTHRDELVAIGEIGLDYYWDKTHKEEQKEVLRRQLLLAKELDLPVILHNREATEDILTIVKEIVNRKSSNGKLVGVFHCFNGSRETAQQILDMGFYLGIGGVLTFKNCKLADTIADLNEQMVLDKMVLETDAPYMAPVPHRGERNESRFIDHVVERLAIVFNCSIEEVFAATTVNAKQLFRLK
ncbi:MAG: TatD family hydrolase [Paludibacteraceae bacterium]|nr:TatD family hydrolase [Paludibacteraceae bacterium]